MNEELPERFIFLNNKLLLFLFTFFPLAIIALYLRLPHSTNLKEMNPGDLSFYANIIGGGVLHVILTPLLFEYSKVNEWWETKNKNDEKFRMKLFLIGILGVVSFGVAQLNEVTFKVVSLIVMMSGLFHIFFQFFGFSLLLLEPNIKFKRQINELNRLGVYALFFLTALIYFFSYFYTPILSANLLKIIFLLATIIVTLMVIVEYLACGKVFRLPYFTRLFLVPLAFYSQWKIIGLVAVHGIEYYILLWAIHSSSRSHNKKLKESLIGRQVLYAVAFFILISGYLLSKQEFFDIVPTFRKYFLFNIFAALAFSATAMHIFLDRHLFRFRDPLAKKLILPALFSAQIEKTKRSSVVQPQIFVEEKKVSST